MKESKPQDMKQQPLNYEVRPFLAIALILSIVFLLSSGIRRYSGSSGGQDIDANVRSLSAYASREVAVNVQAVATPRPRIDGNGYLQTTDIEAEKARIIAGNADSKATIQRRFEPAALIGDSFAEDAIHYKFLDNSTVFSSIGAHTSPEDPRLEKAIGMGKTVFIFTYGTNDMGTYGANVDAMINRYKICVAHIRETVPGARIYIQAILKPRDDKIANYPYYDLYNGRLLEMCNELNVGFFDSSFIMEAHPEMYENDGIHISRKIYGSWLTFIADIAGL